LVVTTAAARVRYLHLLGFRPAGEDGSDADLDLTSNTDVSDPLLDGSRSSRSDEPTESSRTAARPASGSGAGSGGPVAGSADPARRVNADVNDAAGLIESAQTERSSQIAHVVWRNADGEWERGARGIEPGRAPTSHSNRYTLAGNVAIETDNELEAVWGRFKETESQEDRDELIVYYAPLVKYVAGRIAAGLPQTVDQSDLISYGMFGLIDAITKFDPERGFKFETYAVSRVKGAILDELRSIDWVPRSVRSKAKAVERAIAKLEARYHRPPTDEEIADELDLSAKQLTSIYKQIGSLGLVALDEMLSVNGGESLTFGDTLADRRDGPGMTYERAEIRRLLAQAINTMSEREKVVLTLYYYENMTLAEIGRVLGVTESRVCQIHTKAVLGLRSRMESAQREPV
jgi:RNA polymerase sigma factor for flagellar operon FliA